jgi:hypothetical protein
MGQMLTLPRRSILPRAEAREPPKGAPRGAPEAARNPGAAAQGILLALAFSALAWIGLALLVPRIW